MAFDALVVLGTLAAAFVLHSVWQWRRLSHIPGPFWAGLSKYWMVSTALGRCQPQEIKKLNKKYGSLVRIGPNELATDDPDVIRKIMAVRSPYTRGPSYAAFRFDPTRDNLLTMRDDAIHKEFRNKIVPGYSGKENLSMEKTIETQIARLIQLIETKYLSTSSEFRPLDFSEKVQYFTLDVISDLAWGQPLGYLEQDADVHDYIKISKASISAMVVVSSFPTLANLLQSRLLRFLLPNETDKLGFGAFIRVAKKVVAERFKPDAPSHPDMLGSFIRHGLSQDEASGEALLQIIAGSDTSASTVRGLMLHLMANPPAYRKLQIEIDEAIAAGKVSSPIKDAEGRQLPYLQAAIKEGIRMLPPVGAPLFKEVPAGGDTINGMFVPGGTQIGTSSLGLHRSAKIYGEDADLFRPERWLEAEGEQLARMTSSIELAFAYGKWQCPGKGVALMEFNKLFVELLRRFDFSIVYPAHAAKVDNIGMWLFEDFWVRITRRDE